MRQRMSNRLSDEKVAVIMTKTLSDYIEVFYLALWLRKFGTAKSALQGIDDMVPGVYFTEKHAHWFTKAIKLVEWLLLPENKELRRSAYPNERSTNEYYDWRMAVLKRDLHSCQECGNKKDLAIHHIKNYRDYPSLRINIGNGITLCRKCHRKTY